MAVAVAPARNPAGAVMGNGGPPPAPPFDQSTRLSLVKLAAITRPVGGGISPGLQLPTNGLLGGLLLKITGTIGGTVGAVNPLGFSSIVKRVTLTLNSGTVVFSMSGPGYHYIYRDWLDAGYVDCLGQSNGRTAITATGAVLDMYIPMQVNLRDPIGLLLLQNRQTTLTLGIEWEADVTVTATGTFTSFQAVPYLLNYSVPPNPASLPPLRYIHQVLEDSRSQAAAGTITYDIPRGNTYMRIGHGCGIAVAGADSFTVAQLRVNQSNYIWNSDIGSQDMMFRILHGRARPPGVILYDFLGTSGLGSYGTTRDLYDSNRTTDFQSVVDPTGALTFYTVREQLVDLKAA